jgi:PAS domain S-box-containing protein
VAQAQEKSLQTLETRAGLFAQIVAFTCPNAPSQCVRFLKLFAENPGYFAAIEQVKHGVETVAPSAHALSHTELLQLAGSSIVRSALAPSATPRTVSSGPMLLGSPPSLAVVAAVPGRPGGSPNAQVKPTFAAIYGIGVVDTYLQSIRSDVGYDVTVIADGHVLASSLGKSARVEVLNASTKEGVDAAGPTASQVVSSSGDAPTIAFAPITAAGNDNVRVATLAVSEPASSALAAQRSVLRRLVLTALAVLVVVAVFAFVMAQRIADPVRRLTVAAGRIRGGDLDTTVAVESTDEVGALARAFDAMTSSLRGLTGDLRDAAEEESKLRARLETVLGSMSDGLVTTDGDGRVVGANPMAMQLIGGVEADLVGRRVGDMLDVVDAGEHKLLSRRTASFTADGVLRRADGTEVPVRLSRAPLSDQPGDVIVLSDRTNEREIERLKTEFLSNVSHELRTPLTPIRGYAEMLSRRPDLPKEQVQAFVAEILAGTARMSRAVELLVDVAALDAGRVAPYPDEVSVKALVDERLAVWRERYPERNYDLRRRIAAKVPAILVDRSLLTKALDELIDNAMKYTPVGAKVTVGAESVSRGRVRITVSDTGPGIEDDRLHDLLGDFSQADASETRHVGGMGLGLGFVSRVARAIDATLLVTSEPGKGAWFALDVPAVTSTAANKATPVKTSQSARRGGRR